MCVCETFPSTLKEGCELKRVFEERLQKRILETQREELMGSYRNLSLAKHCHDVEIKRSGLIERIAMRNEYKILAGKLEKK